MHHTFETKSIYPYVTLKWKDTAYLLKITIPRSKVTNNKCVTYHTWRQKDSPFYFKDLGSDLIDHVQLIKFDYAKHILTMLSNYTPTPDDTNDIESEDDLECDISDNEENINVEHVDKIIMDLKEQMEWKIKMRRTNGTILSSSESENEDCP
eukprot:270071_1